MKRIVILLFILMPVFCFAIDEKPRMAVMDFEISGMFSESEMRSIIELLSAALFETGEYDVIDVSQRENMLKEIEFSGIGCTEEDCQLEMGKMISAQYIVVGSIGRVGSRYIMTCKMLETESAKTHSTANGKYSSKDDIIDSIENLAAKLAFGKSPNEKDGEEQENFVKDTKGGSKKKVSGKKIAGVALLAAGLASAATGVILYVPMQLDAAKVNDAREAYENASSTADYAALYTEYEDLYNQFNNEHSAGKMYGSVALMGAGGLLSAVSIVLFVLPDNKKETAGLSLEARPGLVSSSINLKISF